MAMGLRQASTLRYQVRQSLICVHLADSCGRISASPLLLRFPANHSRLSASEQLLAQEQRLRCQVERTPTPDSDAHPRRYPHFSLFRGLVEPDRC